MEDFLKRKLEVGDSVVYMKVNYRELKLGRIASFSAKKVQIITGNTTWNGKPEILQQMPNQLVRVDGPELTLYLLKKD